MAPKRDPGNESLLERFPTEWAIDGERQRQLSQGTQLGAPVPVLPITEMGRPVRRETARPDLELDGAA